MSGPDIPHISSADARERNLMSPASRNGITGGKGSRPSKAVSAAHAAGISRNQLALQAPRNHGAATAHSSSTIPGKRRRQFIRGPSPLGDQTRSVTASQLRIIEAMADPGEAPGLLYHLSNHGDTCHRETLAACMPCIVFSPIELCGLGMHNDNTIEKAPAAL